MKLRKKKSHGTYCKVRTSRNQIPRRLPQIREMLQQVGWLQFLENFNGFHKEVTKTFAWSFNGSEVEIGDVKFIIIESFIAEAAELPRQGERWFKNKEFHN